MRHQEAITGTTILVAFLSIPIILVWLGLAAIIIWGAANDPLVLDKIEGLLTALAVLTIPSMKILDGVIDHWRAETDKPDTTTPTQSAEV